MGTDIIREQITTLDESLKHLRENESEEITALPVLDLLSNEEDENNSPADEEMASLELGDATPEELDEYLNAQLLFRQNGALGPPALPRGDALTMCNCLVSDTRILYWTPGSMR
jgi:hypothetical protein